MKRNSLLILLLSILMVLSPALCAFAESETIDNTGNDDGQQEAVVNLIEEDAPATVEEPVAEEETEKSSEEEAAPEEVVQEEPSVLRSGAGWSDDGNYYYDENGDPLKGWQEIDGARYFFNENTGLKKTGWLKQVDEEGVVYWYFLGEDGRLVTNYWASDSKGLCWIGPDGYMIEQTKWIKVGNDWYYIEKGYQVRNKWKKDSKGWCYLGSDGLMVTNDWAPDSKGWCWIGSDGYMVEQNKWLKI